MKEKKLTRKEKSVLNKATYAAVKKEKFSVEIRVTEELKTKEEKKRVFCELIACCVPIYKAVKEIGIVEATVYNWLDSDKDFLKNYTRAREQQAEKLVEQMIDISDNSENDLISDENGQRVNQEVIARSRLRVETRKWIASKMKPRVYGDASAEKESNNTQINFYTSASNQINESVQRLINSSVKQGEQQEIKKGIEALI
jgi:hypothetical protein